MGYQQGSGGYSDVEETAPLSASPATINNGSNNSSSWKKWSIGAAVLMVIGYAANSAVSPGASSYPLLQTANDSDAMDQLFDDRHRYVVRDFDARSTFSNFLPGVAGLFGKPVWSFYVNRGQGIASFGLESKEYPILEFNSANKAYQLTPYIGFRTFIKGTRSGGTSFMAEPFAPAESKNKESTDEAAEALKPTRTMYVGTNEMEINEVDDVRGIETTVNYFTLPEENFAALVRRTTIKNTGDDSLTFSALDGLAKLEPVGGKIEWSLKNIGRTL